MTAQDKKAVPLTDDQRRLVDGLREKYPSLVPYIRSRHSSLYHAAIFQGYEEGDIEGAAWVGVCRAAQLYDATHPAAAAFATYALNHTRSAVQRLIYRRLYQPNYSDLKSLNYEIEGGDEGGTFSLANVLAIEDTSDPDFVVKDQLRHALAQIGWREVQILRLRYECGFTLAEVGIVFNLTNERVRQIQNKAIRKIREAIES